MIFFRRGEPQGQPVAGIFAAAHPRVVGELILVTLNYYSFLPACFEIRFSKCKQWKMSTDLARVGPGSYKIFLPRAQTQLIYRLQKLHPVEFKSFSLPAVKAATPILTLKITRCAMIYTCDTIDVSTVDIEYKIIIKVVGSGGRRPAAGAKPRVTL